MKKKKSMIILVIALVIVSLVSYITFATGDNNAEDKSPLDFGLFASENIQLFGNGTINGEIWANNFMGLDKGTEFKIQSNTWSSNDISVKATMNPGEIYEQAEWRNDGLSKNDKHNIITKKKEMPQIMDTLKELIEIEGNYKNVSGNMDFKDLSPEELALQMSYLVEGTITAQINGQDINNNLIAKGDIDIDLINYVAGADGKVDISNIKPIIIASSDGDITFKGTPVIVGTIYAPNGTVKIEGAGNYIVGNIIAKNIWVRGSGLSVNDGSKIAIKEDS